MLKSAIHLPFQAELVAAAGVAEAAFEVFIRGSVVFSDSAKLPNLPASSRQ